MFFQVVEFTRVFILLFSYDSTQGLSLISLTLHPVFLSFPSPCSRLKAAA